MNEVRLDYRGYAAVAQDGDIALWRPLPFQLKSPKSWLAWGRYISRYTGGPYSHATGIVYWREIDRWMSCGYEERRGGLAEPLDSVIENADGRIDVFRVRPEYWQAAGASQSCVARRLGQDLGGRYAWRAIRLIVSPLLPVIGLFTTLEQHQEIVTKAASSRREGICSQHVARSYSLCGITLCKKPLSLVTPNDLWMTAATEYVATLVKDSTC